MAVTAREPHELLSPKQLADRLGIHVSTLKRWRAAGDVPEPVNGRWLWTGFVAWWMECQALATEAKHGEDALAALTLRDAMTRLIPPLVVTPPPQSSKTKRRRARKTGRREVARA